MKPEKRWFPLAEMRAIRADGPVGRKIVGYATVFDSPGEVMRNEATGRAFREVVKPGAFSRTIKEDDIRAYIEHMPHLILGRNTAGTLRLAEDSRGLHIEIDPPDTTYARDLEQAIERRDITQMSYSFTVRGGQKGQKIDWATSQGGVDVRNLLDVVCYDVSPVSQPAHPDTEVAFRSLLEARAMMDAAMGEQESPEMMPCPGCSDPCPCQCEACVSGMCAECSCAASMPPEAPEGRSTFLLSRELDLIALD